MKKERILWADDEVELLRPYVMFLEEKGYEVLTACSGQDALELCSQEAFDIVFLDENMPGLSGLETLSQLKKLQPTLPVVMITKSEEENIMDMAVGNKIADYLIKPVNPNQILLTLKKNIHKQDLISEQTTTSYRIEFSRLGMQINSAASFEDWTEVYKKLVFWDLELSGVKNEMTSLLEQQKSEANRLFGRFVKKNYGTWFSAPETRPMMSPDVFKKKIFPLLDGGEKVFLIIIDNFRLDQWVAIRDRILSKYFSVVDEEIYCSILPTATQYARNAIFSGLMPGQLQEHFPQLWIDEEGDENKNDNEQSLINSQFKRFRKSQHFDYKKVNNSQFGENLVAKIPKMIEKTDLNVCVLNFIDMLSHARTDSQMIRELTDTNEAYRSLTLSWFEHSFANEMFKILAQKDVKVVITTDHGAVKILNPIKVVSTKTTNVNLRYKVARNLTYNEKEVFEIRQPQLFGLPKQSVNPTYIFALENDFFVYPNNINHYVSYYKDTLQHGGISLEEMLVPIAVLEPKK